MERETIEEEELEEAVKWETTHEAEKEQLRITRTPERVVPEVATHNIEQTQAQIDKIDGVIAEWEAKKAPLQAIVDKHKELWQDTK